MKFGMYIMPLDPITNPYQQSVCLMSIPLSRLGNGSVKLHFGIEYTRNNERIIGRVVFFAVHVVSEESLWVCLCIPLSLLGNGSVNTFQRQLRIVGGIVFYAGRVVSKEGRRLVLSRTSYYYMCFILSCQCIDQRSKFSHCTATLSILRKAKFSFGM
jgi:hypothetical protein